MHTADDQWEDLTRPNLGLYTIDNPKVFAGRVRPELASELCVGDQE